MLRPDLAAEAVRRGGGRMEWMVLDWHERARGVDARFGAERRDEWRLCRLSQAALPEIGDG